MREQMLRAGKELAAYGRELDVSRRPVQERDLQGILKLLHCARQRI
jgi:hypothetical protein